ncbi:hypothetical protein B0H11DRAFT_2104882 [Mycena galericulata]|nr:hypothetical protein B0H11DRAFT_2104882 [Mycena galericulata]
MLVFVSRFLCAPRLALPAPTHRHASHCRVNPSSFARPPRFPDPPAPSEFLISRSLLRDSLMVLDMLHLRWVALSLCRSAGRGCTMCPGRCPLLSLPLSCWRVEGVRSYQRFLDKICSSRGRASFVNW